MYSIMASFLFWIMLIHKQDCAVIRTDLPNHAIEMEIEIQGSVPREETSIPQRRVIHVVKARHPKRVMRSRTREGDEESQENGVEDEDATEAPSVDPATSPPSDISPSDPANIPVFMNDLNRAIDELELKLQQTNAKDKTTTKPGGKATEKSTTKPGGKATEKSTTKPTENTTEKPTEKPTEPPTEKPTDDIDIKTFIPSIQSIDDIMNILKKAQELNADVERKDPIIGDNVDWVRIKIPKRKS